MLIWVITDGTIGMENQALGLAEAIVADSNSKILIKRVKLPFLWDFSAPYFRLGSELCMNHSVITDEASKTSALQPPWPDVVIACGRRAIIPALYIKSRSEKKGSTKIIYIQDPKISLSNFDMVVCPYHDQVRSKNMTNLVQMIGSCHRITPQILAKQKILSQELFAAYPAPRIAVLLGGNSRAYQFRLDDAEKIIEYLKTLLETCGQTLDHSSGGSLLISTSRRTPAEVRQKFLAAFANDKRVYLYTPALGAPNPYLGLLAWGDVLLITCDSVNMICEASVTDKPVYLLGLSGGNRKLDFFHTQLIEKGRVNWLALEGGDGRQAKSNILFPSKSAELFKVEPFNEMPRVSQAAKQILSF